MWAPTLCALAVGIEMAVFHIRDIGAIGITVVIAGTLGLLAITVPDRVRTGSVIASTIATPVMVALLGNSFYAGHLRLAVDPLAVVVSLVWSLLLLPAGIGFALSIRADEDE